MQQSGQYGQAERTGQSGRWENSLLVHPPSPSSLLALMHDMRNLVASIVLYCDLLDDLGINQPGLNDPEMNNPGPMPPEARHYGGELRLIAHASQQMLNAMAAITSQSPVSPGPSPADNAAGMAHTVSRSRLTSGLHFLDSLAGEVKANQRLLSALAGPGVSISITLAGGSEPISISAADLSRVLINLTRNAAEAMGGKGRISITLEQAGPEQAGHELVADQLSPRSRDMLRLTFSDSGPGIPASALETVFSPGYTTHLGPGTYGQDDPTESLAYDFEAVGAQGRDLQVGRGLGLSIVRSLVASAGGTVRAVNHAAGSAFASSFIASSVPGVELLTGAAIVLEFPILSTRTQPAQSETNVPCPLSADTALTRKHSPHTAP
jgi:signal transduction histidine kinase